MSDDISRSSTLPSIAEEEASVRSSRRSIRTIDAAKDQVAKDVIEELDVSASLGATGKSVMLSMSDVPDISAEDAQQIVEMFSKELAESITGTCTVQYLDDYGYYFVVAFTAAAAIAAAAAAAAAVAAVEAVRALQLS